MEPPQSQSEQPSSSAQELHTKRYKPIWRILLISNLALGAYMFARASKKNKSLEDSKAAKTSVEDDKTTVNLSSALILANSIPEEPLLSPVVVRQPIPEDQQRELFKWMLEEKRKVKPKDPEEKKRIDEEKAILKQFIRAKSIPRL